jgi:cardiolipin synthase
MTLETHEGGVARAGLLYTAPTLGSTPAERYLALSIGGARERLYVTNAYFAPDKNFVAVLIRAAKRGVDVRILVGGPRTDVRAARLAAHGRYEALLEAGVRVYEYQPTTLAGDQPRGLPPPPLVPPTGRAGGQPDYSSTLIRAAE